MARRILSLTMLSIFMLGNLAANGLLQNGTSISVTLTNSISSSNSDLPNLVVAYDVKDPSGNILIKAGTLVLADIFRKEKRSVGLPGEIQINFISTTSADGQLILLTGTRLFKAKDKKGKVIGIAVGTGWLAFPMLAFLAKKGDDVVVDPTTMMNAASVMGNYSIK